MPRKGVNRPTADLAEMMSGHSIPLHHKGHGGLHRTSTSIPRQASGRVVCTARDRHDSGFLGPCQNFERKVFKA